MAERHAALQRLQPHRQTSAKRVPAQHSVSLRHEPMELVPDLHIQQLKQKQSQEPYSTRANPPSTLSSRPAHNKDSSGESSNAERWFESSNNNVRNTSPSFLNDEAPFLLRNASSEDSPGNLPALSVNPHNLPYRTAVLPLTTVASSSEDYRSVIDDLTIQNKKLKRRLKKFERATDPRLQEEKLFEVRVHGLPVSKKKELEDMLKKFVMSCDDETERQTSSRGGRERGSISQENNKKKSSSHTSTRFGDSAYASASGRNSSAPSMPIGLHSQPSGLSNQHSVSQSGLSSNTSSRIHNPQVHRQNMSQSQHQNIQSYLHDIPAGLMPKQAIAMTERSKKKLVVRRLESIFAGKAPLSTGHQQPLQQQEVSQLAARADRRALEATGQRFPEEGAREAQFIVKRHDSSQGNHDTRTESTRSGKTKSIDAHTDAHVEETDFATTKDKMASEQRPTRPLDLDPYRAQIPEENIRYIRHLGFSPQNYGAMSPLEDGHGWIYVNLLINLAQLHTLNVTSDFVRKAVQDVSSKLEVSNDGRKLRWKGGIDLTRTSSNGSPDDEYKPGSDPRQNAGSKSDVRKLGKLAHSASNDGSSEAFTKSIQTSSRDKFAYTPLFSHKQESEDDDDDDMSDDNVSGWSSPHNRLHGDSSGFASSGMKTNSSRRRKGDDGPIIFYNRANFCTDLSGDSRGKQLFVFNNNNYSRMQTIPLGSEGDATSASAREAETRGPFSWPRPTIPEEVMDIDDSSHGDLSIHFNLPKTADDATDGSNSVRSEEQVDFEASGIGGVMPVDNFAIRVKARQQVAPAAAARPAIRLSNLPPKLRKGLSKNVEPEAKAGAQPSARVRHQVISERRKDLPPSELPPPSFYPLTSPEDESDEDSDSDPDEAMSDVLLQPELPAVAPQPMLSQASSDYGSDDSQEESSEEDDDDATDGIDLLAHARLVDPASIQAREREYDCEMAERLAEEIPAGSSAATAGGGSGFNSPASHRGGVDDANKGMSRPLPNLKRTRTQDSLSMAGLRRPTKSPKMSVDSDGEEGSVRS